MEQITQLTTELDHLVHYYTLFDKFSRGGKIFHSLGNDKTSNEDVAAKIFNSLNSNAQFK
jgi:hypothetical protein